jgi:hypothetical protein
VLPSGAINRKTRIKGTAEKGKGFELMLHGVRTLGVCS